MLEEDQLLEFGNDGGLKSKSETISNLHMFWIRVKVEYPEIASQQHGFRSKPSLDMEAHRIQSQAEGTDAHSAMIQSPVWLQIGHWAPKSSKHTCSRPWS